MGRDASLRTASALVHVRSRSVRRFHPSRRAWYPQSRRTTSPRRSTGRLHTYRERGASREADREVFQRSHGLRRCLPRSHDRNACRSHHPHYRPRFPSLPAPQPPSGSLCDTRVILPPVISAETEPSLLLSNLSRCSGSACEFTVNVCTKENLLLAFSLTFALRSGRGRSHRSFSVVRECR